MSSHVPVRVAGRQGGAVDWNPVLDGHRHLTLDTSHTSVSGTDPLALLADMGDRLAHVHIAEVLERLAELGYAGTVVVEISTGRAANDAVR